MKRLITFIMSALLVSAAAQAAKSPKIDRIDPPYWWAGMQQDTLQLMVYGTGIGNAVASVDYPGVTVAEQVACDSPNYTLLYLNVSDAAQPGTLKITFSDGKKKTVMPYTLKERTPGGAAGFDASDVLYLIMPDRFARGAASPSDAQRSRGLKNPVGVDRANHNARHGGDISGIREHLDYVDSLGVTAVWVNPVLENDMHGGSYHGYATTDYYRVDPRFGTNDDWSALVSDAHARGIKVVMDMIFNHCGSDHPWMNDLPMKDWINRVDKYAQTNHRLSTAYDPYASKYDRDLTVEGWFCEQMPDLNQLNPHMLTYLIQNSIFWIEDSKIDGIRMDTHPYADIASMAKWIAAVEREYPEFNIVGECWFANEGAEAFWQRGGARGHSTAPDSNLPTVMDFHYTIKGREAFGTHTTNWGGGLFDLYDHLSLDYLFPDPQHILTFLDNHDTDRFLLEEPDSLDSWKQAVAYLLTSRGIPQIYYGTEILMNGTRADGGDGNVRRDFPGGFDGDTVNAFTAAGRTTKQNEAWDYLSRLLHWRRGNKVISEGSLKHFAPNEGLYVYQRALDGRTATVMLNGTDAPTTVDMTRYEEIFPIGSTFTDVITGNPVTVTPEMTFPARATLILQ